ncbi:MAG: DUF6069 family protein [Actinomycetota bacterium]
MSAQERTGKPAPAWAAQGIAALAATTAATLLYLIETRLFDLDLRARTMPGSDVVESIELHSVLLLAGGASLLAWLAAAILRRRRSGTVLGMTPRSLFVGGAILILLSSFYLLTWAESTEAVLGLLPLHLLTAAIVIPGMSRTIR